VTEPQTEYTATEIFEDLSGFDEIAIRQKFGEDVTKLRKQPFMFMRSLAFIDQRRRLGLNDKNAYEAVMRMPVSELQDYFPDDDEPDEIDPDEPVTDKGKDESGRETTPDFLPDSA